MFPKGIARVYFKELTMAIKEEIYDAVLNGDSSTVDSLIPAALGEGLSAESLLQEVLIAAMSEVGARFEAGDYFVPEMLISARAMKAGLAHLRPLLVEQDVKPVGKIVIGTIKGDLHDIGKNLVGMMLEGAGFQVIDLGVDVGPEQFVKTAKEEDANLIGLSALLTTTMANMKATVDALKTAGLYGKVKVLIGGAPVTQAYAEQIGAHGFAADASAAANLARSLMA
jgi:5-methyltetrahydrofolate--homocysteine methyltransferase